MCGMEGKVTNIKYFKICNNKYPHPPHYLNPWKGSLGGVMNHSGLHDEEQREGVGGEDDLLWSAR